MWGLARDLNWILGILRTCSSCASELNLKMTGINTLCGSFTVGVTGKSAGQMDGKCALI